MDILVGGMGGASLCCYRWHVISVCPIIRNAHFGHFITAVLQASPF